MEHLLDGVDSEVMLDVLLRRNWWPRELKADVNYCRDHDDSPRGSGDQLAVRFDRYGDAYLYAKGMLRFRTDGGGGDSLRVRTALMILAEAIRLENAENPQTCFSTCGTRCILSYSNNKSEGGVLWVTSGIIVS